MTQTNLNLEPKLVYGSKQFLLHEGIKGIVYQLKNLVSEHNFFIAQIIGDKQFGKTHLSVYLTGLGFTIVSYEENLLIQLQNAKKLLVIDDAQNYFLAPKFASSFVALYEIALKNKCGLVFISSKDVQEFTNDQNVLSRFQGGFNFTMGVPDDESIIKLIDLLARQRGLALSTRQLAYLEKRLPTKISEISEYLESLDYNTILKGEKINFNSMKQLL